MENPGNANNAREAIQLGIPYVLYKERGVIAGCLDTLWILLTETQTSEEIRDSFGPKRLLNDLRRAGYIGALLLAFGWFVGWGGAQSPALEIVQRAGTGIRGLATLWLVIFGGVFAFKYGAIVGALRFLSGRIDSARHLAAHATSDLLVADDAITAGELISEEEAKSLLNAVLVPYLWVMTLGIFTLFPEVIAVDRSVTKALAFLCVCSAIYLTSIILGIQMIEWARRFNFLAFVGLFGYFIVVSPVGDAVAGMVRDSDAAQSSKRKACLAKYDKQALSEECKAVLDPEAANAIESERKNRDAKTDKGRFIADLYATTIRAYAQSGKYVPPVIPECADGRDNDGDGLTDYPQDKGCAEFGQKSERAEGERGKSFPCDNGIDDDGNGVADNMDSKCWVADASGACDSGKPWCRSETKKSKKTGKDETTWKVLAPSHQEEDPKKKAANQSAAQEPRKPAAVPPPRQVAAAPQPSYDDDLARAAQAALGIQ